MDRLCCTVTTMDDPRAVAQAFARYFPAIYLRFHRRDGTAPRLTNASRAVLQHLALSGPVTIGELAGHLDRAQSVVSEIVSQLEDKGLLERQADRDDRRRRLIWLSDEGRASLEHDREVLSVELLERAITAMGLDDRGALLRGVDALLRSDDLAARHPPGRATAPPITVPSRRKERK